MKRLRDVFLYPLLLIRKKRVHSLVKDTERSQFVQRTRMIMKSSLKSHSRQTLRNYTYFTVNIRLSKLSVMRLKTLRQIILPFNNMIKRIPLLCLPLRSLHDSLRDDDRRRKKVSISPIGDEPCIYQCPTYLPFS